MPEVIFLEEYEKFYDGKRRLNIVTVGERDPYKIFFNVYDVSKELKMPNIRATIIDSEKGGYIYGTHYVYFYDGNNEGKTYKKNEVKKNDEVKNRVKKLFLTYEGMLRLLFVSHNKNTTKFIKWAIRTLFAVQMGTQEQKLELVSSLQGITHKALQEIFKIDVNTLPCVYFAVFESLDKLSHILKKDANYDGDKYDQKSNLGKFGCTESLKTRLPNHRKEYSEFKPVVTDFKIAIIAYIDPKYIYEAEKDIKQIFTNMMVNYKNHTELVAYTDDQMAMIRGCYENIHRKYGGSIRELVDQCEHEKQEKETIKKLHEDEIEKIKASYEAEIEKLKIAHKHEKDLMHSKHENELANAKHDNELANAKHENELTNAKHENARTKDHYEIKLKEIELKLREAEITLLKNKLETMNPTCKPNPKTKPIKKP